MGISPSDARRLSFWEFTARRTVWNKRHSSEDDDGEPVELPDPDYVKRRGEMLEARGIISKAVH